MVKCTSYYVWNRTDIGLFCCLAPWGASGLKCNKINCLSGEYGLAPWGASGLKYAFFFILRNWYAVWLREELVDWNWSSRTGYQWKATVWLREELVDWNRWSWRSSWISIAVWLREELVDWNRTEIIGLPGYRCLAPWGASGLKSMLISHLFIIIPCLAPWGASGLKSRYRTPDPSTSRLAPRGASGLKVKVKPLAFH